MRICRTTCPSACRPVSRPGTGPGLAKARAQSRDLGAEGLMLKAPRRALPRGPQEGRLVEMESRSPYHQRGDDLRAGGIGSACDALHRFHLRRVGWQPAGPLHQGLFRPGGGGGGTDAEFNEITRWVRKNTTDRFGPVRAVRPEHVFEIAFEGIQKSTRHKSGVRPALPPHGPLAPRQAAGGGQHARRSQGDAGPVRLNPRPIIQPLQVGNPPWSGGPDVDAQPVEVATWVLRSSPA